MLYHSIYDCYTKNYSKFLSAIANTPDADEQNLTIGIYFRISTLCCHYAYHRTYRFFDKCHRE